MAANGRPAPRMTRRYTCAKPIDRPNSKRSPPLEPARSARATTRPSSPTAVPCRPVSIRSWLSREFVRVGIHTYAFAVLTLGANFVSGVVTARALAPAGRGEAVAIAMLIQNIAFIFALGCVHAVSYRYAREPETAGALATTWTLIMIPLALLAFAV